MPFGKRTFKPHILAFRYFFGTVVCFTCCHSYKLSDRFFQYIIGYRPYAFFIGTLLRKYRYKR